MYNESHIPAFASLYNDTWWRPNKSSPSDWLQVVFGTRMLITAVAVQGAGERTPHWVEFFRLRYSEKGDVWWTSVGNGINPRVSIHVESYEAFILFR